MPKTAAKRPPKKAKRKPRRAKPKQAELLVRTSERSSFEACRWQWHHSYNEKLTPIREAPALRFGTLIHKALEVRYPKGIKRGPKPAETFERLFNEERESVEREWKIRVDDEWMDMLDLGIVMLEAYVERYGRDEDWKVIASEMTFRTPIYLPADAIDLYPLAKGLMKMGVITARQASGTDPLFSYVGTMDGVWQNRMDGGVRINDYKTTGGDPIKEAAGKYALDEQATAYWAFGADHLINAKLLKPRELRALDGMLYTWLRKGKPDERPKNAQGLALNQPGKDILLAEIAERGGEPPKKGEGSGKNGSVVVADLMAVLGSDAAQLGEVSKDQPAPLFHRELVYRAEAERAKAKQRASEQVLEMLAVRAGILPLHKAPGTGYPQMQCNGCPFRDFCEIHEADGDWELMRDASTTTWQPYGDHEIKEEGKAH